MWIVVYNCHSGARITNATFTVSAYNNGDGNYYMYIGAGYNFCVGAPTYATVCGNTDSYGTMYASLCPAPSPPPPNCSCWS